MFLARSKMMKLIITQIWIFYILSTVFDSNRAIRLTDFYPYGRSHGDQRVPTNDDGSSPKITVSTLFPYFNQQFNSLYVNTNGAISFSQPLSTFTPSPFPLTGNRKIVAPFWCDIDTREGGDVWFYETNDQVLLFRATEDVRKIFPEQASFHAGWLFVATWENVAFYGTSSKGRSKRNTFQCILITNGRHSFTIFLYNKIQWTTGTASGGNADTGLGGTPAQVGFDAGDGINFKAINVSRTSYVINVPKLSNVDTAGKFVYRIDTETVKDGGCSKTTGGTLSIFPRYGTMFGGTHLSVGGPCVKPTDNVVLKFNEIKNPIPCIIYSEFSVKCVSPTVYRTGDETVTLHVTPVNGNTLNFTGIYTFINPAHRKSFIHRVKPKEWTNKENVTISWSMLPFEVDMLAIELFKLQNINGLPTLESDGYIAKDILGSVTSHSFLLNATGHVAVIRIHGDLLDGPFVWSDMFVVKPPRDLSKQIYEQCESWLDVDRSKPELDRTLLDTCPCTIMQARLDISRFNPDPQCNMLKEKDDMQVNCMYQVDAVQCMRMAFFSERGHDNQCCYDTDGNLIRTKFDEFGGTAHRYHYKGGTKGNIPFLSNMQHDVAPYMFCCQYLAYYQLTNTDHCENFLQRRLPSSCKGYVPPRLASTRGDPHMITLDGLEYTFNGVGEFTLLTSLQNNLTLQARMEQFTDNDDKLKPASVITSIAIQCSNNSDIIEMRLNSIRLCDVLQNGELIDFAETKAVDVKGATILSSNGNDTNMRSLWTLITCESPNLAINVSASSKMININVVISDVNLRGAVMGLLGNFNGKKDDDFSTPYGVVITTNSPLQKIHNEFGLKWIITDTDSLFTYPVGKTHQSFQQLNFQPTFLLPSQCSPDVRKVCGDDAACRFDFCTTGDAFVAKTTRSMTDYIREMAAVALPACGDPGCISNGYWNFTGNHADIICDTNYVPSGQTIIQCSDDGNWGVWNTSCEMMPCEEIFNVTNGYWNVVNRTATLICDDYYTLRENVSMECLMNGSWVTMPNDDNACTLIACEEISNVTNGYWAVSNRTAILVCNDNSVQKDKVSMECLINGSWSKPPNVNQFCEIANSSDKKPEPAYILPVAVAVPSTILLLLICIYCTYKHTLKPTYEIDNNTIESPRKQSMETVAYSSTRL